MKKYIIIIISMIFIFFLNKYIINNKIKNNFESTNIILLNKNIRIDEWKNTYLYFLNDFLKYNNDIYEFSLWDLDNNGIPELLILQLNENGGEGILSIYSYDDNIIKIDDYIDHKTAAGYRYSYNTLFPGLFTFWWGGGQEYYGYLTINNGILIHENIKHIDRSIEPPNIKYMSNNKHLIDESTNVYPHFNYNDNILKFYIINNENIENIFSLLTYR